MMMKRACFGFAALLFGVLLFSNLVVGAGSLDYENEINKAISCLDNQIRTAPALTFEESIFSLLAGVNEERVVANVNSMKHGDANCWPNSGCTIKQTAQTAIAKKARGENVRGIIDWLKNQTGTPSELIWYLQVTIDGNAQAQCNLGYDGRDNSITVNSDLTLSGNPGSCFTIDNNGYWLKIADNCVDKTFSVGCTWEGGGNFLSNLVYKETAGGITFVSSNTQSSPNRGRHEQKITAKCFKQGNRCDYEGSLWATTALYHSAEDVNEYVPYLLGLSKRNSQFFPEAFLMYILGQGSNGDQFNVVNSKVSNGHWDIPGGYNRFIDTGLAMIALGGADSASIENYGTLGYLFSEGQQTAEGCWNNNNIIDTAFVIYSAGWRIAESGSGGGNGGTGGTGPTGPPPLGVPGGTCEENNGTCRAECLTGESAVDATCSTEAELCCMLNEVSGGSTYNPNFQDDCEAAGNFCGDRVACLTEGGSIFPNYNCVSFAEICCSIQPRALNSCASLGGRICGIEEQCSTSEVQSSDGSCCVNGVCRLLDGGVRPPTTTPTTPSEDKKGTSIWIWIVLLIILIGLVVLGIIYKDKIRMWWYKRRGKVKTSKVGPGEGGIIANRRPPPIFGPPMTRGRFMPARATQSGGDKGDKEMEDTLKKLREMSK